jgi:hypothetical protein
MDWKRNNDRSLHYLWIEQIMTLKINDNGADREMTEAEIKIYEADAAIANKFLQDLENKKSAKVLAQAAAEAKLAALGLTVDDLKALGLGNN